MSEDKKADDNTVEEDVAVVGKGEDQRQATVAEVVQAHVNLVQTLKSNDYDSISKRLVANEQTIDAHHAAVGVATESGEILDVFKRSFYYGEPFDNVNAAEEIGDLLYYVELLCAAIGVTSTQCRVTNIAKLQKRYGEEFSEEKATNRDVEAEREVFKEGYEEGEVKGDE